MVDIIVSVDDMEQLIFRSAVSGDADAVAALYDLARGGQFCTWNEEYPTKEDAETDLRNNNLFVLVKPGGRVIGAVSIVGINELDYFDCWKIKEGAGEFGRVVIDREYQGCGLASIIVKGVIEEMRRRNFSAIHISVAKKNIPARRTYDSLQFSYRGECFLYRVDFDLMELSLL